VQGVCRASAKDGRSTGILPDKAFIVPSGNSA